jgi:hypothetical protein
MDSFPDDSFFLPGLHRWSEEFTTRRDLKQHKAAKPYVAAVQGGILPLQGSDIIRYFVNTDESEMLPDATESRIDDFCPNARRVEDLQALAAAKIPVALLDDSDSSGRCRTTHGNKLGAEQLYEALQRPVCRQ